jgi:recombination protein RecR
LVDALDGLQRHTRECLQCHHLCEDTLCSFCSNPKRDESKICIVELPQDLVRIEDVCDYDGLYHVLGGRYAPLEGIFPEDLNIKTLIQRVAGGHVSELVLALNPNTEGEATCDLITRSMTPYRSLKLTRLATGLPRGSEIGFSGRSVLRDALAHRREVSSWR